MSLYIRLLEEADLAEADLLLQAAFQRAISFQRTLRLHLLIEPQGFWVAVESGRIVGTVGCVDYGRFAYVALMSVHPDAQRRGIGRRLMDHALTWLDDRNCPVALLDATDEGGLLYETIGFVDDSIAYHFEREVHVPPMDGVPLARFAAECDFEEIAAFDEPLFGADRRKVLERLWAEHRERCLVRRDSAGNVSGYLFARDPNLGPWAAADPQIAEDLLVAALSLVDQDTPHVLVPRSNRMAVELLMKYGFVERRRLRHMRRGGDTPPGQPSQLYGQMSLGHG